MRAFSVPAFRQITPFAESAARLIIDAGCGTGHSTRALALADPLAHVIGVDQSADRLSRAPDLPDNARLLRAELADFWRLLLAAGWPVEQHYLFYPNPWPKPAHLKRRWHAHPVFPCLLAIGGRLELRTNFLLYAKEFQQALHYSGHADASLLQLPVEEPVSPFERKYRDSGHPLYQVIVDLS
ncbi:MAG: tRNA (guanine(46)-N(7))-methyltransferase TrmB [Wenzhouxiangella sp.]